jgi:hypothetical protein
MALLTDLGSQAATHSHGAFAPTQFVTSALQELFVCLGKRNTDLDGAIANFFTKVSLNRGAFMHGATSPTVELA